MRCSLNYITYKNAHLFPHAILKRKTFIEIHCPTLLNILVIFGNFSWNLGLYFHDVISVNTVYFGISNTDITNTIDKSKWSVSPNHLYFSILSLIFRILEVFNQSHHVRDNEVWLNKQRKPLYAYVNSTSTYTKLLKQLQIPVLFFLKNGWHKIIFFLIIFFNIKKVSL